MCVYPYHTTYTSIFEYYHIMIYIIISVYKRPLLSMILFFFCIHTLAHIGHGMIGAVQCPSRNEANKSLATLAVSSFDIPGDTRFPLNAFMTKPSNRGESGKWIYLCVC